MSYTRRNWIMRLIGAFSFGALWHQAERGEGADAGRSCSGTVSSTKGGGIPKVVVEFIEPDGRVSTKETDGEGVFAFTGPKGGPFIIQFREGLGNARVFAMSQLTAGTNQLLSVTIEKETFLAAYNSLQAAEGLAAFVLADRENKVGKNLFGRIPQKTLLAGVDDVVKDFSRLDLRGGQKEFLTAKAAAVRKVLETVG